MIKTVQLTKTFGSLKAVDNLSLDIKRGKIYGFIGPNGAGKTTTIKMLAGILPPTSGKIKLGKYNLNKQPIKAKRLIGYIPDNPYVYPTMTGSEFLHFTASIFKIKNKDKKIKKMLKVYPIQKMIDGYFKDFSRGTKQKLSIIAAFLHNPKILLIDEPILGLDPQSSLITKKMLKNFSKKGGTVFVSSHTLPVIQELCHQIGIIDKGKLIFQGSLKQLKKKAKSKKKSLEPLFLKITK